MAEKEQITSVARERADKRIDGALGQLKEAAHKIGKAQGIPEGIAGHSIEELLGRMAYVPSMARELRRQCGQEMAKHEINEFLNEKPDMRQVGVNLKPPAGHGLEKAAPAPTTMPMGTDVGSLDISVQSLNALREAGLNNIGDVVKVPDAHLVKINGLGEKSVAHLRAAIAKAATQGS